MAHDTPSRSGLARSYSPNSQPGRSDSLDGRDPAVASQYAAFQAVDQQILARRVGLPAKVEPIPLKFEKKAVVENGEDGESAERPEAVVDAALASEDGETDVSSPVEDKTVSVSHVITNVIILQSFLFELASLVQVRAGLFDEVRFA
ncbi:putative dna polymerase epsilon subunit protein [Phaeoacremonium minimum UCRPA7]|uniref:Putative dna polymerase epsilon subunit protein n=1 Tax=Phaeoacremonium minimum (strain UCR-PA7) TaxID=1286976 RepID=R8BHG0_PHAM7|nr:putative dna polymerase epsilon subunit protein [Phaeoacremonium minimum UCRPA7]EON98741.1 putative dna polymerase epsilon subunit protein [Phaeoacremonium minimum UCRPA7]